MYLKCFFFFFGLYHTGCRVAFWYWLWLMRLHRHGQLVMIRPNKNSGQTSNSLAFSISISLNVLQKWIETISHFSLKDNIKGIYILKWDTSSSKVCNYNLPIVFLGFGNTLKQKSFYFSETNQVYEAHIILSLSFWLTWAVFCRCQSIRWTSEYLRVIYFFGEISTCYIVQDMVLHINFWNILYNIIFYCISS